jgi:hypothetical protein
MGGKPRRRCPCGRRTENGVGDVFGLAEKARQEVAQSAGEQAGGVHRRLGLIMRKCSRTVILPGNQLQASTIMELTTSQQ